MENNLEYYFKDFVSKIVNKIQKTKLVYNIEKV